MLRGGVVVSGVPFDWCLVCVKLDWYSSGVFLFPLCVICSMFNDMSLYLHCFFVCRCLGALCVGCAVCVFCVVCV